MLFRCLFRKLSGKPSPSTTIPMFRWIRCPMERCQRSKTRIQNTRQFRITLNLGILWSIIISSHPPPPHPTPWGAISNFRIFEFEIAVFEVKFFDFEIAVVEISHFPQIISSLWLSVSWLLLITTFLWAINISIILIPFKRKIILQLGLTISKSPSQSQ